MKKIRKKFRSLLKSKDVIYVIVCVLLLVLTSVLDQSLNFAWMNYLDIEMLTSVVVAFTLTSFATLVARWFTAKFEDSAKLTGDYDSLVKKYELNAQMLSYRNSPSANFKLGRKKTGCKGKLDNSNGDFYKIPVTDVIQLYGRNVIIRDYPEKKYTLPEFSSTHYRELIAAHDASSTYNQINLRVDGIYERDEAVYIDFSRTTYFDSLVTNRAIDFKIDGVSVRDLYACGPLLDPLERSPLSNHMGFNGMVETADGKFVFIKRHKRVSVGKNTMQCSVAASLKAKRALEKNGVLSKKKIIDAIALEIEDEFNLTKLDHYEDRKKEIFAGLSFEKNVLYFYRDLMEGGKPQLMFYAKIALESEELMSAYAKLKNGRTRTADKNGMYCKVDGFKMLLVDRAALKDIYLAPDEMVINGRRYPATPSAVGTVVMLHKAMDEGIVQ